MKKNINHRLPKMSYLKDRLRLRLRRLKYVLCQGLTPFLLILNKISLPQIFPYSDKKPAIIIQNTTKLTSNIRIFSRCLHYLLFSLHSFAFFLISFFATSPTSASLKMPFSYNSIFSTPCLRQ